MNKPQRAGSIRPFTTPAHVTVGIEKPEFLKIFCI